MLETTRSRRLKFLAPILCIFLFALIEGRANAAVTVSSLKAQAQGNQVIVTWVTATETNNAGFNISRGTSSNGTFTQINSSLIPSKSPGSLIGASYSYTDTGVSLNQTLYYKLQSVDFSSGTQSFGPVLATQATTPTATATLAPTTTTAPTQTGTPPPTSTTANSTATAISSSIPTQTATPANSRTATVIARAATRTFTPAPNQPPASSTPLNDRTRVAAARIPTTTQAAATAPAASAPQQIPRTSAESEDQSSDSEDEQSSTAPSAESQTLDRARLIIILFGVVILGGLGFGGLLLLVAVGMLIFRRRA